MFRTAVILTIGNEILSGDVLDDNSHWLAKKLFSLGVELKFIFVLPDEREIISSYIKKYQQEVDFLITVGGMGPTPDDVTKESVADSFSSPLVRKPEVEQLIKDYFQEKITEEKFLLALFPEKSEPLFTSDKKWAIGMKTENVFSFPGTPNLLRDAFPAIESLLKSDPLYKSKISLNCEETFFSDIMARVIEDFPEVEIGSYPSADDFRKVKLIFKSRLIEKITQCKEQFIYLLRERLPELEIS